MANSQHSPMYKACVRSLLRTHTQSAPSTFRAYSVQMPFPGKYILYSEAWHAYVFTSWENADIHKYLFTYL